VEHHSRTCRVGAPDGGAITIGSGRPVAIIAGPCVIESAELCAAIARAVRDACAEAGLPFIFKASFDKANRSSGHAARGPGIDAGLETLASIRRTLGVPITTDVHVPDQAGPVAEVVDLLQVPAFLCRQTDLLLAVGQAAARFGRAVNIKKGQFLAPAEMAGPVNKVVAAGCREVILTERGTFFGYHRLVNDFIGVGDLMEARFDAGVRPAICFDATHSAQLPGAQGHATGGRRERVPMLARAAAAAGVDALFLECHPDPDRAPSDASTMLRLADVPAVLRDVARIASIVREG
jgi:2-dehydro-3-deoxyphosphooctonate aldolase (KDO 8-P synthase)